MCANETDIDPDISILSDIACTTFMLIFLFFVRVDIQSGALGCNLWPPRSPGRQTDPGSRAENQASSGTACFKCLCGSLSPTWPGVPYPPELQRTAAGGAAHWIVTGHFITELESVQCDKSSFELAQTKINCENSTEKSVKKTESGKDKERPVASWAAWLCGGLEKRAGCEWPGLAGHLFTHWLRWKLQGQSKLTSNSWTIQVLVPCWNQKGPLAKEGQEQTGPERTNSKESAGVQKRHWKISVSQSRPACGL